MFIYSELLKQLFQILSFQLIVAKLKLKFYFSGMCLVDMFDHFERIYRVWCN